MPVQNIIINLNDGRYNVLVTDVDGTTTGRMDFANVQNALTGAGLIVALHEKAEEPNPTPGEVERGGLLRPKSDFRM